MPTMTKKRRVINYLASGKGLTEGEARSRFGVANLRATISDIRDMVEAHGNWEITSSPTSTGKTVTSWKTLIPVSEPSDSIPWVVATLCNLYTYIK